jgi:hypothetical protein
MSTRGLDGHKFLLVHYSAEAFALWTKPKITLYVVAKSSSLMKKALPITFVQSRTKHGSARFLVGFRLDQQHLARGSKEISNKEILTVPRLCVRINV